MFFFVLGLSSPFFLGSFLAQDLNFHQTPPQKKENQPFIKPEFVEYTLDPPSV